MCSFSREQTIYEGQTQDNLAVTIRNKWTFKADILTIFKEVNETMVIVNAKIGNFSQKVEL